MTPESLFAYGMHQGLVAYLPILIPQAAEGTAVKQYHNEGQEVWSHLFNVVTSYIMMKKKSIKGFQPLKMSASS